MSGSLQYKEMVAEDSQRRKVAQVVAGQYSEFRTYACLCVHDLFCVSVCCNSSPSLLTVLTRLVASQFSHSLTDDVIVLTPPMEQRDSHSMGGEAFTEDSGGH